MITGWQPAHNPLLTRSQPSNQRVINGC